MSFYIIFSTVGIDIMMDDDNVCIFYVILYL
jgi:hypothetical protein